MTLTQRLLWVVGANWPGILYLVLLTVFAVWALLL